MKTTVLLAGLLLAGCGSKDVDKQQNVVTVTVSGNSTCSKTGDAGSGTTLSYGYTSTLAANGDRSMTCTVTQAGVVHSGSATYTSSQPGNAIGSCVVLLALAGDAAGSAWNFENNGISGQANVWYSSAGSAHDRYTYTFSGSECTY